MLTRPEDAEHLVRRAIDGQPGSVIEAQAGTGAYVM
jgi:hypothetical protein